MSSRAKRGIRCSPHSRVRLVDSAEAVAAEVVEILGRTGMGSPDTGALRILVTDAAARVTRIARLILPGADADLELVDLPD